MWGAGWGVGSRMGSGENRYIFLSGLSWWPGEYNTHYWIHWNINQPLALYSPSHPLLSVIPPLLPLSQLVCSFSQFFYSFIFTDFLCHSTIFSPFSLLLLFFTYCMSFCYAFYFYLFIYCFVSRSFSSLFLLFIYLCLSISVPLSVSICIWGFFLLLSLISSCVIFLAILCTASYQN